MRPAFDSVGVTAFISKRCRWWLLCSTLSLVLFFISKIFDSYRLIKDGQKRLALFLRIPVGWNDSFIPCIIFLHVFPVEWPCCSYFDL